MLEKVELIKTNGDAINVDLISEFDAKVDGNPKRFVLLTANEIDQNGLIKIFASSIVNGKLVRIESDDEWTLVKNIMRSIISSSNGDFTYTNTSDNMSYEVDDNFARIIAVQDSAKQALVNDYNEKKPKDPELETTKVETNMNPNAAIYPNQSETVPIGSEVVPGVAEMHQEDNSVANEVANTAEEVQPVVNNNQASNSARDELINSIITAVDKYIASTSNNNTNNDVQAQIAKMQEELNKMNESLNA